MRDYIDPAVGIPLAIILWLLVVIMYLGKPIKRAVDDWAAERRHNRRMRSTQNILDGTSGLSSHEQKAVLTRFEALYGPKKRGRHRAGV